MRMPGVEWERGADSVNGEGDGRGTGFRGRERETEKGEWASHIKKRLRRGRQKARWREGARGTKRVKGKRWELCISALRLMLLDN